MNAQVRALAALYAPTPTEIAAQLPAAGAHLATQLEALGRNPNPAHAWQVALQLRGALATVQKLQEAMARASGASG